MGRGRPSKAVNLKSGDTLLVSLFSRPTAFPQSQDATDKTLQSPRKRLIPERPARPTMPTHRVQLLFAEGAVEQALPITNHGQPRGDLRQASIASRQVRPRIAPTPLGWAADQSRPSCHPTRAIKWRRFRQQLVTRPQISPPDFPRFPARTQRGNC